MLPAVNNLFLSTWISFHVHTQYFYNRKLIIQPFLSMCYFSYRVSSTVTSVLKKILKSTKPFPLASFLDPYFGWRSCGRCGRRSRLTWQRTGKAGTTLPPTQGLIRKYATGLGIRDLCTFHDVTDRILQLRRRRITRNLNNRYIKFTYKSIFFDFLCYY